MRYLLHSLGEANGFLVDDHNERYHPPADVLGHHLRVLPPNAVYINHANYWEEEGTGGHRRENRSTSAAGTPPALPRPQGPLPLPLHPRLFPQTPPLM